jgi:hypothetical protein
MTARVATTCDVSVSTRFFAGSAEDLVLRLIEDEHLSSEQLEELRQSARSSARTRGARQGTRERREIKKEYATNGHLHDGLDSGTGIRDL